MEWYKYAMIITYDVFLVALVVFATLCWVAYELGDEDIKKLKDLGVIRGLKAIYKKEKDRKWIHERRYATKIETVDANGNKKISYGDYVYSPIDNTFEFKEW